MVGKNEQCCDCRVCVSVCPPQAICMQKNARGFMLPVVDETLCVHCDLCSKRCPMETHSAENTFVPKYYAAVSKDLFSLKRSASGGAFYVFAKRIIENGGVVFGCVLDAEMYPVIRYTDTVDGLAKMQGSKYVEADVSDSFAQTKAFLESGRSVLYSGTPCKIAALKKYLNKEYATLVCCEIICHGVAGRDLFQAYLAYMSKKLGGEIIDVTFRDKKKGWGPCSGFPIKKEIRSVMRICHRPRVRTTTITT